MHGHSIPTENVELESTNNDYNVEMYEALVELHDNKAFQKVFLEGYFEKEAVRITSLLATDHVRNNGLRPVLMENLVAISNVQDYLSTIVDLGAPVPEDDEE